MVDQRATLKTILAMATLLLGSLSSMATIAAPTTGKETTEAPVYGLAVKTGDWAEYVVDEAVNATVLCNSDINPSYYIPLSKGDRVRITVTSVSDSPGYSTYMNGTNIYGYYIPTLSVTLNGEEIRTGMLNIIPFFPGAISMFNLEAIHPTKGDGYWDSCLRHWKYIESIGPEYVSNFTLSLSGDRARISCTLFGWDSLDYTVSRSLGVPFEISGHRNQTVNKYLSNGRYHVSLNQTNIMGLIGPPRPHEVSILPTGIGDTSSTGIRVNWSTSSDSNFTRYEVYMATAKTDDPGDIVATITDRLATTFEATGLDPAAFYYFTVRVWTPNTFSDSEVACIKTIGSSPASPLRIAKVEITDPRNPLLTIDARDNAGLRLIIQNVSKQCTISVFNLTAIPQRLRPEPWALDDLGRLKTLGKVVQITSSDSADFVGGLVLYTSNTVLDEIGVSFPEMVSGRAMRISAWDNTTVSWRTPYEVWSSPFQPRGGWGSGGGADSFYLTSDIDGPNYFTVSYRLPPSPVTLDLPTRDQITSSSVHLKWSMNGDPDFYSYVLYRSSLPSELGDEVSEITERTTTSYTVTGINPAEPNYFTVRVRSIGDTDADLRDWSRLYADSNTVTPIAHASDATVVINQIAASDYVADSDENVIAYYHASWSDDGSDISDGYLMVEGTWCGTNSTGWARYMMPPGTSEARVWNVYCEGVTVSSQTAQDLVVRRDLIFLNLNATDPSVWWKGYGITLPSNTVQRLNVGSNDLKYTGVYAHEYPTKVFRGTVTFNDTLGKGDVGSYTYQPASVEDPLYNLTSFWGGVVKVIYDRIKIVDGGVSSTSVQVNQQVTVWYKAVYEYDNVTFDGSKGVLKVNGEEMTWSTTNERWERQFTSTTAQKMSFEANSVRDDIYNLTAIDSSSKTLSAEWANTGIPGYQLPAIAAGVLLAAAIILHSRKHIEAEECTLTL